MVRYIITVKPTCFGVAFTTTTMPVIIAATLAVLDLNNGLKNTWERVKSLAFLYCKSQILFKK
jgi:hypothetical protein